MIKVLIEGKRKKIQCTDCEALLSYEEEDIQQSPTTFSDHYQQYIVCPQCQSAIYIGGCIR